MSADLNIDRELAICEAAQSGPWKYDPAGMLVFGATADTLIAEVRGWGLLERLYGATKAMAMQDATGVFIAHARTGYPLALRKLARLRELLANVSSVYFEPTNSSRGTEEALTDEGVAELREILGDSTKEQA